MIDSTAASTVSASEVEIVVVVVEHKCGSVQTAKEVFGSRNGVLAGHAEKLDGG